MGFSDIRTRIQRADSQTIGIEVVYIPVKPKLSTLTMSKRANKYDLDTRLSHKLSGILRHGRDGFREKIDKNGWLEIEVLLRDSVFCQNHNVDKVILERVVRTNDKQRYKISDDGTKIKANQGHTIRIDDESLVEITLEQAATYSAIVHGTYYKSINVIMQSGLSRMKRQHMHLTASDRVDKSIGVISGFRGSCEVLIYIDMPAAISSGIKFYVSENNVILSPGNDQGLLPSKFFEKVIDKNTSAIIFEPTQSTPTTAPEPSVEASSSSKSSSKKTMENRAKNLRKKIAQ